MLLSLLLAGLLPSGQATQNYEELLSLGLRLAEEKQWVQAEDALRKAAKANLKAAAPHVELGRLYVARNQPQLALAELDRALRLSPGDFSALFLRGTALVQMEMFSEAVLELAAAIEKRPDDVACRRTLALASLQAAEPGRSVEVLGPLIETGIEDASVYAIYGASLAGLGRYEEAVAPLEKALDLDPQQPQALLYLGRSLLSMGRHQEAGARFRKGISFPPPQNIRVVLGLAESKLGLGRREEARRLLDALLARHPRVARGWYLRGLIEAEENKYAESTSSFQKAIDYGYQAAETYLNLGMAHAAVGDPTSALAAFDQALEQDPHLAAAYYYKGVLRFEQGEAADAVQLLERSAAFEPEEPRTFLALAEAYLKLGRLHQALQAAENASQSTTLSARALYVKGLVHHERIEYPEAEAAYREAIALGLDSGELYLNLGRALYAMARHGEAKEAVDEALHRDADAGEGHLLQGKVQVERREYDDALKHLDRAVELMPEKADAWYRRGVVHTRQGRSEKAIADWRKAIELDPELVDAYYRLGRELAKVGQIEEGEKLLAEFQRRSTAADRKQHQTVKLRTTLRRAIELSDQRQDGEAMRYFNEALTIDPRDPLPYLALAEFHASRGKVEDAESALLEGLKLLPENLSIHEMLLSLYEATGNQSAAQATRKRLAEIRGKSP
ncbi:MAG: tetratricopeptide repeat protein [Acidobacteriota bacterium]